MGRVHIYLKNVRLTFENKFIIPTCYTGFFEFYRGAVSVLGYNAPDQHSALFTIKYLLSSRVQLPG